MKKLIEKIESQVENPSQGLQEDIFYFVGRLTPYINFDLLVKNDLGQIYYHGETKQCLIIA